MEHEGFIIADEQARLTQQAADSFRNAIDTRRRDDEKQIFRGLVNTSNAFESQVGDDHDVGIVLPIGGISTTLAEAHVRHCFPSLVAFFGCDEAGREFCVIQSIHNINVALVKLQRATEQPKRPIGFYPLSESQSQDTPPPSPETSTT